jgi:hypothetical protein
MTILELIIRVDRPAVGLSGAEWILGALLGVLGCRLRPDLPIREAEQFFSLPLLVGSSSRINGSWTAVCALVHVGHMLSRLVVTDDVLPCDALLAQNSVAIVVSEAADALDRR